MPAPSQDLVCSFLCRENKQKVLKIDAKRSTEFSTRVWNSKLSCKYVIHQNIRAYAQTSALKHRLNSPEQKGKRAVAACLSPESSTKISWSFVYYNRITVGASGLLAAALICQHRGENRSGRLCLTGANQLLRSEPGTIKSPAFSSTDGPKNPSEAPPRHHRNANALSTYYSWIICIVKLEPKLLKITEFPIR